MIVMAGNSTQFKTDENIPDNYVIIPTTRGWHVIRGEEYIFIPFDNLRSIYEKALEAVFGRKSSYLDSSLVPINRDMVDLERTENGL